jgi:UDP-N-acetylglucosamine 2-epimerase
MTDSGGVQEEAVIMRKPCVTLRDSTERQETLLVKANRLCPVWKRENSLVDTVREMVGIKIVTHPYGQNVTEKTVEIIDEIIGNRYDTSLRNVHRPENELRPRRSLQAGLALTS